MFLWMIKDVVQNVLKIRQYLLVAQKHESNIRSCILVHRALSSIFSSSFYAKCTKLILAADLEWQSLSARRPPPFGRRTNAVTDGTPDM